MHFSERFEHLFSIDDSAPRAMGFNRLHQGVSRNPGGLMLH